MYIYIYVYIIYAYIAILVQIMVTRIWAQASLMSLCKVLTLMIASEWIFSMGNGAMLYLQCTALKTPARGQDIGHSPSLLFKHVLGPESRLKPKSKSHRASFQGGREAKSLLTKEAEITRQEDITMPPSKGGTDDQIGPWTEHT